MILIVVVLVVVVVIFPVAVVLNPLMMDNIMGYILQVVSMEVQIDKVAIFRYLRRTVTFRKFCFFW